MLFIKKFFEESGDNTYKNLYRNFTILKENFEELLSDKLNPLLGMNGRYRLEYTVDSITFLDLTNFDKEPVIVPKEMIQDLLNSVDLGLDIRFYKLFSQYKKANITLSEMKDEILLSLDTNDKEIVNKLDKWLDLLTKINKDLQ